MFELQHKRVMESSTQSLQSRKMIIYTFASFLCFMFLLFCHNQRQLQGAVFTGDLETPPSLNLEDSVNSSEPSVDSSEKVGSLVNGKCDIFVGRWVYDPDAYPLYHSSQCPFLSEQVSCQKNGRPDSDYEHWRWEPTGCQIPRFNGTNMLEILRGKRVVIAGDSINLNQWESLTCLLYSSLPPSRVSVNMQSRIFRAMDYNCSVEFNMSPFLVNLERSEGGKKVLNLDEISKSARLWRDADVIVFNSGHWWTHSGKFRSWDLFQHGGKLVEEMDRDTAFEMGLKKWAQWVDSEVDPSKTQVLFRGISPEHKVEHHCDNQTRPITDETYIQRFPKSMIEIVERTLHEMRAPVKYLNITHLSEYRREAHPSMYVLQEGTANRQVQSDCSHWCLPGLPDTWNVLTYISIIGNPS